MARPIDYSRWKDIEVSDDEDDTHPNIDTPSLFRWRHQARVEKMAELENEKKRVNEEKLKLEKEKQWIAEKMSKVKAEAQADLTDPEVAEKLEKLQTEEKKIKEKEDEVKKKEKMMPWNVDTISHDGFEKTVINKPKERVDKSKMTDEEQEAYYKQFIEKNEKDIKAYGMISKWDDAKAFLLEKPDLVCDETANYLAMWCLDLAMEEKVELMEHISKQVISMQFILELAKQLDRDPRSCTSSFFTRIQTAEQEYKNAFNSELESFKERIKALAKKKLDALVAELEEKERQKRLGPGGLDPVEVYESLPECMRKCFDDRDIGALQGVLATMDVNDAKYHMKRCIDSGMWVPDASAQAIFDEDANQSADAAAPSADEEPVYEEPHASKTSESN